MFEEKLKNADYSEEQLLKLGEDWSRDVRSLNKDAFAAGSSTGAPWGLIASLASTNLQGLLSGAKPQYDATSLNSIAGTGNSSRMGIGYTTQNAVGSDVLRDTDNKAIAQTLSGNIGYGISYLFGGRSKLEEEIRRQLAQAMRTNAYNANYASTLGMQLKYAQNYGNTEFLNLYSAKNGLDVDSYVGPAVIKPNEYLVLGGSNRIVKPKGGVFDQDSVLTYINDGDRIATDDFGTGGVSYARLLDALYDYQNYLDSMSGRNKGQKNLQIELNVDKGARKKLRDQVEEIMQAQQSDPNRLIAKNMDYKNRYIPHAALGIDDWGNILLTGLGVGIAGGLANWAIRQPIYSPNLRVRNMYADSAIKDLYSLRPNTMAVNRQILDEQAKWWRNLMGAGGLSTGQKRALGAQLVYNSLNAIANANAQAQDRQNALIAQAAQFKGQLGEYGANRYATALANEAKNTAIAGSNRTTSWQSNLGPIPSIFGTGASQYGQKKLYEKMLNLYDQSNKASIMAALPESQKDAFYKKYFK